MIALLYYERKLQRIENWKYVDHIVHVCQARSNSVDKKMYSNTEKMGEDMPEFT